MSTYRNKQWGFEITLPLGWLEPGLLHKLLHGYDSTNPEFFGPNEKIRKKYSSQSPDPANEAALKFTIGPISPEPTVEQHQRNLEVIAKRHKHCIRDTGKIQVLGKDHATIVYEVPRPKFENILVYRFKNYHLIFKGIEYVITSKLATLPHTNWPLELGQEYLQVPPQIRRAPNITNLQAVYMYDQDYDDIVSTFLLA
jgi:hypothetical protein